MIGRYISADGYVSTGQEINGYNMFVYCGNNPVNRTDSSGTKWWSSVKKFVKKTVKKIKKWVKKTFGKESTTSNTTSKKVISEPSPVVIVTGKTTTKITSKKNNSNPVVGYSDINTNDRIISSTSGVRVNISKATIDMSFGMTDIGIAGAYTEGDETKSFGIKLNLMELKFGFEYSTSIKWDEELSETTFTNGSISAIGFACVYALSGYGVPVTQ